MPARQQSDRRGLSDGGDRDDRIEARDQACNALVMLVLRDSDRNNSSSNNNNITTNMTKL